MYICIYVYIHSSKMPKQRNVSQTAGMCTFSCIYIYLHTYIYVHICIYVYV